MIETRIKAVSRIFDWIEMLLSEVGIQREKKIPSIKKRHEDLKIIRRTKENNP